MSHQYAIRIVWNQTDGAYLASTMEIPELVADGESPQAALNNLELAIKDWVVVAKEDGLSIPAPVSHEDLERLQAELNHQAQQQIEAAVRKGVARALLLISRAQAQQVDAGVFLRRTEMVFAGANEE